MAFAALQEVRTSPVSKLGPLRLADYLAAPEEPRLELIHGRFEVSPSPSFLHQLVADLLGELLRRHARGQGGRVATAPLDVVLADHSVVQPDVVYLGPERRHLVAERIEGAPTLVVEVLSPKTAARDRGEKLALYAAAGVEECWIVDPASREIECLVNRGGSFAALPLVAGRHRSPAIPGLELEPRAFWRRVDRHLG